MYCHLNSIEYMSLSEFFCLELPMNIWLLTFLLGCGGHIKDLYEKEQQQVLMKTAAIPTDWQPDARLRVSYSRINELAKDNLQNTVKSGKFTFKPLGMKVVVNTKNTVQKLTITDHKSDSSFSFSAHLKGKSSWKSSLLKGSIPYTAQIKGRANISFENSRFYAKLSHIDKLQVETKSTGKINVEKHLQKWLREKMKKSKPIPLGKVQMKKFQMLASRVRSQSTSADIEFLSNSTTTQPLKQNAKAPLGEWELEISNQVVNSWIRRNAFRRGIIAHGVAVDPRSFSMKGRDFVLKLRLWKLQGWGKWWRDYEVKGQAKMNKKKLLLKGQDVKATGKSRGAGVADPLALLAEGFILEAIADNLKFGIPIHHQTNLKKQKIVAKTLDISGNGDALRIWGNLQAPEAPAK